MMTLPKPTWQALNNLNASELVGYMNSAVSRRIVRHQIRAKLIRDGISCSMSTWYKDYDPQPCEDGNTYRESEDTNIMRMCRDILRGRGMWF